jgi:cytochrome c peroxidase
MLPMDISLLHDPVFREYIELFASDQKEFFGTFSIAFAKV